VGDNIQQPIAPNSVKKLSTTLPARYYDIEHREFQEEGIKKTQDVAVPVRTIRNEDGTTTRIPDKREVIVVTTNGDVYKLSAEVTSARLTRSIIFPGGRIEVEELDQTQNATLREVLEEIRVNGKSTTKLGTIVRSQFVDATASIVLIEGTTELTPEQAVFASKADEQQVVLSEDVTEAQLECLVHCEIDDYGVLAALYHARIYKNEKKRNAIANKPTTLPELKPVHLLPETAGSRPIFRSQQ